MTRPVRHSTPVANPVPEHTPSQDALLEEARDLQRRAERLIRHSYRLRPAAPALAAFVGWLDGAIFGGLQHLEEAERTGRELDAFYVPNGYLDSYSPVLFLKPEGAQIIDMAAARARLRGAR